MLVGVSMLPRRVAAAVAAVALTASLAAPAAYTLATVGTPQTGSIVSAGPATSGIGGPGGAGGVGGLLTGSQSTTAVTLLLLEDAGSYDWVAATVGANSAAGYQLATEQSVMPIGGFNGSDPSPTLAQFQEYVAQGRIHWFIADGGGIGGPGGGSGTATEIAAWVEATFPAQVVDGVTLHDLSRVDVG